jgi:hypothetical protein
MANFRINGRTYRDVQKMDANELKELRRIIVTRMTDVLALGRKLNGSSNRGDLNRIAQLNAEMDDLNRKSNQIDAWAKQKLKADVNAEVDNIMAGDGDRGVAEDDLSPNRTLPINPTAEVIDGPEDTQDSA